MYQKNLDRTDALRQVNEELRAEIIERKRTDAALRETEKQFRRLADNMQDLVPCTSR